MNLGARLAASFSLLLSSAAFAQGPTGNDIKDDASLLPVKFAIYSGAWNARSNAGLRLVAQNQSDDPVRLTQLTLHPDESAASDMQLGLNLLVPANGWAEQELPYFDLLSGSQCVLDTMNDDWKLAEISNYPLNPSVRGLIIEDTQSFRIYQCVRSALMHWEEPGTGVSGESAEWLMYHFERRPRL